MTITVHQYLLGPMDNYVYILADESRRHLAIVDPAWDGSFLLNRIEELGGVLTMVLITHAHFDHVNALDAILKAYDVPVYVSHHMTAPAILDEPQVQKVQDGDTIQLGDSLLTVMLTPGHSVCGQSFVFDQGVITGDTLFVDGCGRADFDDSQPDDLYDSLQRIQELPDHLWVYGGHAYSEQRTDTLGNQRFTNPYLQCADRATFIRKRMGRPGG